MRGHCWAMASPPPDKVAAALARGVIELLDRQRRQTAAGPKIKRGTFVWKNVCQRCGFVSDIAKKGWRETWACQAPQCEVSRLPICEVCLREMAEAMASGLILKPCGG